MLGRLSATGSWLQVMGFPSRWENLDLKEGMSPPIPRQRMSVMHSSFSQSVCCQHEDLLGTVLVNSESKAEKASQIRSISGDFILDFL